MLPPPPTVIHDGDVIECAFQCLSAASLPQFNIRHWYCVSVGALGISQTTVYNTLSTLWGDAVTRVLPVEASYVGAKCNIIHPFVDTPVTTTSGAAVGLATLGPLPPQTALCIRLIVGGVAPRRNGMLYIPSSAQRYNSSSGRPAGGWATATSGLRAMCLDTQHFLGVDAVYSFVPSVWSRVDSVAYPIESIRQATAWSPQRRRSPYRILPPP